jgi:hypothetical protein
VLAIKEKVMKLKRVYLIALLLVPAFFAGQAIAIEIDFSNNHSSIRCTDGIVKIGEPLQVVLDKCGEPIAIAPGHSDEYNVWMYQVGASKFMYYLGFLNGQLDRIVSRPCVNNDPDCYDAR